MPHERATEVKAMPLLVGDFLPNPTHKDIIPPRNVDKLRAAILHPLSPKGEVHSTKREYLSMDGAGEIAHFVGLWAEYKS